ncbi:1-deoxy-D-xylulose-5-phosphate reductoisomerase [Candidatus Neomarinimicrobiota bacterium]
MMRKISILGSTGSIGTQALEVVDNLPGDFEIYGLSTNSNARLLAAQARKYRPDVVVIIDPDGKDYLASELADLQIEILLGRSGLIELAQRDTPDLCLNALVGGAGMEPTLAAIKAGVDVALSNKESMVMAGEYLSKLARDKGIQIYPVDSEHSAIWQCLTGEKDDQIARLILTGSGGPFRTLPKDRFNEVTVEQALNHPNWDMGPKITIDSATMMNKGLEVIEARWLFGIPADRIDIVVHPQSIIHSMIEFADGSVKAQLGVPDMKVPIQYALTYPDHRPANWERLDLPSIGQLDFEQPDMEKFPCIALAYAALDAGGSAPAVLNMANDRVVAAFLDGKLPFDKLPSMLEDAVSAHHAVSYPTIEEIINLEAWVDAYVSEWISGQS